jgi:hypothetical protein
MQTASGASPTSVARLHHEVAVSNFVLSIPSSSRATGDTTNYCVYPPRELPGNYKVRVQVAPFAGTNDVLELRIRVGGATFQSTDSTMGYQRVLSLATAIYATEGTMYVRDGLRGPIDIMWVDPTGAATDAALPEHCLYLDFEQIK